MLKPRVAVLVSGGGTNLQALIDARDDGRFSGGELALVISSRAGVFALARAKAAGIKTEVVERGAFPDLDTYEAELLRKLSRYGIDVIVLAGFLHILSAAFVSHYPDRILNVHPSLIPAYCGKGFYGLKVHKAVLAAGERVTGATVHMVNEVPDGGRILMQKEVRVLPGDTPETLQRRVMEQAEWLLLPQAVEMLCVELAQKHMEGNHDGTE